jgi:hypothetical protein
MELSQIAFLPKTTGSVGICGSARARKGEIVSVDHERQERLSLVESIYITSENSLPTVLWK